MTDNVSELKEQAHKRERQRLTTMIETLQRRQGERRLFMAEIENIIERREREITNLRAQLEALG